MNSDGYIKVGVDEEEPNHVFDPILQGAEEVIQEIEGRLEKIFNFMRNLQFVFCQRNLLYQEYTSYEELF
jgi:hypothetical protein